MSSLYGQNGAINRDGAVLLAWVYNRFYVAKYVLLLLLLLICCCYSIGMDIPLASNTLEKLVVVMLLL